MNSNGKCFDREKIFGCVHKMLEPAEEAEVRRHLDQCAGCRRVAREFEKLDAVLGEWRAQEPSPWFDQRLKQALAERGAASPSRTFFGIPRVRILALAMLAILVVAGGLMFNYFRRLRPGAETNPPVAKVKPSPATEKPETLPPAPREQAKVAPAPQASQETAAPALPPEEELTMYRNLAVLENFDMLENFDVLSELPNGNPIKK
jgi:Putative zinc-finger